MDTIIDKQIIWAKRNGIVLDEKRPYAKLVENNLFKNLSTETRFEFENGDGGELKPKDGNPAKMAALRSSSALCVNVFDYFRDKPDELHELMVAMGLIKPQNKCRAKLKFECKDYKIYARGKHISTPNIDVVIETINSLSNKKHIYIIESKFTEPYSSHSINFFRKDYYLKDNIPDIWRGPLGNLYSAFGLEEVQEKTQTVDKRSVNGKFIKQKFNYLDAAQLTKHLMGTLQKEQKSNVTLVYLWYDKNGEMGAVHRKEIEKFVKITHDAKIEFKHCSYQELIMGLYNKLDYNIHKKYLDYITERYL